MREVVALDDGLLQAAGGILSDAQSADILLDGLVGTYTGHSYVKDVGGSGSVAINGQRIDVIGCEFSLASSSLLRLAGQDNRVVN